MLATRPDSRTPTAAQGYEYCDSSCCYRSREMKRDQCNLSAERISLRDAQQIERYRCELYLLWQLQCEGHTHDCAFGQIFKRPEQACTCADP